MPVPDRIIAHFNEQAVSCRRLGSPFTAELLDAVAGLLPAQPVWAAGILAWRGDPKSDALALRVAGALHRVVLQGDDTDLAAAYAACSIDAPRLNTALTRSRALLDHYLQSPPQTNDPQRAAVLLGGFLQVAAACPGLPLHCREIGASAGLNLAWDSYAYDFGTWQHGEAAAAPLHLAAQWQGARPPAATITVQSRAGCDIAPLDAGDANQRQRLLSYIWADQPQRLDRVRAALAHALQRNIQVEQRLAADFLARELAQRQDGVFVLYHSIVWQYVAADEQQRIAALMQAAGSRATSARPLAWLRFEPQAAQDGADLRLTLWNGSAPAGHPQYLAIGDFHGRWVRWIV